MDKFVKIKEYGQLYIDKIIFESTFPIVFTCLNDNHDVFIVVCCKRDASGIKWLAGKTDGNDICRMLRDEITVRQLLLDYSEGRITINYSNDVFSVENDSDDWKFGSKYLPKEDSYMYSDEGEFDEEIRYFSSLSVVDYESEKYKDLPILSDKIGDYSESIELAIRQFSSALGELTINSEIVRTLGLFEKVVTTVAQEENVDININKIKTWLGDSRYALVKDDASLRYDQHWETHITDAA